ncbi:MAG: threonylcarbamoyl-AMP synthase [Deltaproteobacteria bacterium]|nr:threonylcarbamoyl-AMP synthase [Deltaproteobacteria bacterium]MBW2120641.1 threonylcarbamoyl-AMP synthase [Deltaproteobacteria bacterium]
MEEIARLLRKGGIIAYPTETVYGLGVDAFNEAAVGRLFELKSRAPKKPVSVLVRDQDMLDLVVSGVPPMARPFMEEFWPGALTIVFPASDLVPSVLTGQTGTIGVRISPHPFVRGLFQVFDSPLTSTSANISGGRSLMEPEDIVRTFGGRIDLVIDMPGSMEGRSSTLLDVTGERPRIIRRGAVEIDGI